MATLNLHSWGWLCTTIFAGRIGRWWIVYCIVCIWFATYQEFHSWKVQDFSAGMDFLKASGPINSHLNHHLENHCNWYSSKSANTYLSTSVYTYCMYNYYEGTCRRSLLYLLEAPVLGPWAHLGFHYISDPNVFLKSILRDQNVDIRKNSNSPEESHDPITGWWFETFFIFPFHIWDVILNPLTNSIIFQDGWNHQPGMFSNFLDIAWYCQSFTDATVARIRWAYMIYTLLYWSRSPLRGFDMFWPKKSGTLW